MIRPLSPVSAEFDEPILFRTARQDVYEATLATGSLWLMSDQYFREVEDQARSDLSEGVNASTTIVPIWLKPENGPDFQIQGPGHVGQQIRPHYILSMHGSGISAEQLHAFGGCTFGIGSITKLSAEMLYRCSLILKSTGYRFGQVYYQQATLAQSHKSNGASAIQIGGVPPVYLNPLNTDVLRKQPVAPFIEQDEWRIVVFTEGYLDNDPKVPLQINVAPSHFYPYFRADNGG